MIQISARVPCERAEATAKELLVDDGWKLVDVEAEAVAVNGHYDRFHVGPTVELVAVNGHHDDAEKPQRSLFSWAEFMAEPIGAGR